MTPAIERLKAETAEEFLTLIHPRNPIWGEQLGRWISRGHANAAWPLLPTAFRRERWAPFGGFDPEKADDAARTERELRMLRWFGGNLNNAGEFVPCRDDLVRLDPRSPPGEWPKQFLDIAALAQHQGLPTRLLDFTSDALVAAYFAASTAPAAPIEATHLCVWAVDSLWLRQTGPDYAPDIWLSVERATRKSNPNLHAQSGLFVVWTGETRGMSLDSLMCTLFRNSAHEQRNREQGPILRLLTLPREQASHLHRLLVYEGITAAKMFPGPAGVVRQIEEQAALRLYDAALYDLEPPWDSSPT